MEFWSAFNNSRLNNWSIRRQRYVNKVCKAKLNWKVFNPTKALHLIIRCGRVVTDLSKFWFREENLWRPTRWIHIDALHINLSYWPMDQSLKFSRKNIENWRFWKTQFFWVGHFGFFFSIFFALSPWKSVKVSCVARMGRNFYDYPGFHPKTTHPKHSWGSVVWHTFLKPYYRISSLYSFF